MKLKNITLAITAVALGCASLKAQTPEEIVTRMSAQLDRADEEGFTMDFMMKLPIIGEVRSHNLIRGDKAKMLISSKEKNSISWTDATTQWDYDPATNEISISAKKAANSGSEDGSGLSSFEKITEGYDLQLQEETADAWYFLCKKKKSNKDKDDPKKMDLAVYKATYLPLYLRAKKSVVTVAFENITIGVSEESVTFDPAEFPNAKIIDKR